MSQSPAYREYIKSEKWRALADEAKQATGGRCQGCDRQTWGLQAHHLTYERLGNERATDIWVVCSHCHLRFHPPHKKRVNKERKWAGKPKIRGTLGIKKKYRPKALSIIPKRSEKRKGWTPEERERLLAEAEALILSRR